jgi:PHD/YefM family antitoxin component YafN of YafNO toxin-antitoxin module
MDTPTRREVRSDALRRELRPLLNSVERDHAHVTIKRYDEDTAVIVPVGWYQRATDVLAAYADDGLGGDVPVSAQAVRHRVVRLAGLLDGMRKLQPEAAVEQYWPMLNEAVSDLAGLLPENIND